MKVLGAALVLWGALDAYLRWRGAARAPIRLAEDLREDLAVLRYQVCALRRPLPEVLAGPLGESAAADTLWRPLLERLGTAGERGVSLAACWREASTALPPPLARPLEPLGEALAAGGERLAAAVEETREEITRYLREETARQMQQGRLTAALCLSGALLLILVCI